MAFGERLKELRIAANLSREQLAEKSGVARGTIRDLEQGLHSPSWQTAQKLAAALGVTALGVTFQDAGPAPPKAPAKPKKRKPT